MAKIEVNAFVSDWKYGEKIPNPSWGMKVSEPHSKKVGDKWEKVGATNYTVKAAFGVDIDFSQFSQGERVAIKGTQVSEAWEKNGVKGKTLVIKATEVDVIERGEIQARNVGTQSNDNWAVVDDELPF